LKLFRRDDLTNLANIFKKRGKAMFADILPLPNCTYPSLDKLSESNYLFLLAPIISFIVYASMLRPLLGILIELEAFYNDFNFKLRSNSTQNIKTTNKVMLRMLRLPRVPSAIIHIYNLCSEIVLWTFCIVISIPIIIFVVPVIGMLMFAAWALGKYIAGAVFGILFLPFYCIYFLISGRYSVFLFCIIPIIALVYIYIWLEFRSNKSVQYDNSAFAVFIVNCLLSCFIFIPKFHENAIPEQTVIAVYLSLLVSFSVSFFFRAVASRVRQLNS
jgi:hypothetical protein